MAGAMATSIFGSLLISSLVSARIPYAMARDGVFVKALGATQPDHARAHPRARAHRPAGRSSWCFPAPTTR